jgi:hypothetical protein
MDPEASTTTTRWVVDSLGGFAEEVVWSVGWVMVFSSPSAFSG